MRLIEVPSSRSAKEKAAPSGTIEKQEVVQFGQYDFGLALSMMLPFGNSKIMLTTAEVTILLAQFV